jgi:hypothetical protein
VELQCIAPGGYSSGRRKNIVECSIKLYRREFHGHCRLAAFQPVVVSVYDPHHVLIWFSYAGSINNIDDTEYKCLDGTVPDVRNKVISGVVGASSSGTSIQVANLLRLFKIPQVPIYTKDRSWWTTAQNYSHTFSYRFPSSRRVPS